MNGVLDGIRVLDLTQMVAGPLCTMLLGDLGADVVKVEPPDGDAARHIGVNRPCGQSDYFLSVNRNKRSIVLDLKAAQGVEALKALAAEADVVVENFRPGTMEKLGIGYEVLRADNKRLIYCGLTGFGSSGPYADRPALDPVIQAMSGVMQLTGTPTSGPLKTGMLLSDFVPPIFGVIGILGALRAREAGGVGQRVEVSMLDATVFSMVPREQYFFSTGRMPQRLGNAHHQLAPWNTYATSDGRHLMIVSHNEKYWLKLVAAIGRPELAADERFVTNTARMRHHEVLDAILAEVIATRTVADWIARLTEGDVLFSLVRDFPDVFADPVVRDSLIETIRHPTVGELPQIRSPIRLDANPVSIRRAPPLLGEHTQQVLASGWPSAPPEVGATAPIRQLERQQ
jgi:crotonobetainyl-CoA:carnitine CoA-transferase CaiB-like acyl-CoA transferase